MTANMPRRPPLLVLDLDGTLADTMRDLIPVLNRVTATAGLAPIGNGEVGHVVGHGARAMIEKAFAFHGRPLDEGLLDRLFDRFIEDYSRNLARNTVLFDGVARALDRFAEDGWLLAVCTNKQERLAARLIGELGQAHRFAAISGGDTFAFRKPDPRHLVETIALAGGVPARTVMVGDSVTDIDTARAAGIPVVAVDFGYSGVPVAQLRPDRVISHYDELWEAARALVDRQPVFE
ncbi:MAG: phosphoglycolate phosphatase, bacterial [Alphaproteobacteria bacterium]|nr:MAG: phosphoglycolate phosphatase, bacterial [Alphaproteobacteria bacterium]